MVPTRNTQSQTGFTKFPNEMFGQLKPSSSYVWLALQSHSWKRDGARPSIASIIEQTGLSESTVKRAIRELVAAKVLTVTKRGDASPNQYGFPPVAEATFTKFDNGWWRLGLDARQAMVLLAVQHFNSMELGAIPGRRELARMTGINADRILREVIPSLQGIGVLDVDQRASGNKRLSNAYRIVPVADIEVAEIVARAIEGPEVTPHGPEMTPLDGPEMTPHGLQVNPLMAPTWTPKKTDTKKTDQKKTETRKTEEEPQRLRRADEGQPVKPELPVGQEGPGDHDLFLDTTTSPGPQHSGTPVLALSSTLSDDLDSGDTQEDPDWLQALRTVSGRHPGKPQNWIELIAQNELKRLRTLREYRERQEAEVEARRHPRPRLTLVV